MPWASNPRTAAPSRSSAGAAMIAPAIWTSLGGASAASASEAASGKARIGKANLRVKTALLCAREARETTISLECCSLTACTPNDCWTIFRIRGTWGAAPAGGDGRGGEPGMRRHPAALGAVRGRARGGGPVQGSGVHGVDCGGVGADGVDGGEVGGGAARLSGGGGR